MGKIEKILKKGPVEGQTTEVYPVTSTKAVYDENNKRLDNIITGLQESIILAEEASKPIILTTETTEVDEETYQKLLSNDVDVVFKSGDNLCILTFKVVGNTSLGLNFTGLSLEGETTDDLWFYGYEVSITKDSPHNCTINQWYNDTLSNFLGFSYFINKSTLSPVLQEIDLTGTDADIKAKLDQFAADWKELTGADTLEGARFIGKLDINQMLVGCIFAYNSRGYFDGISLFNEENYQDFKVSIYIETGAVIVTPLFSHLEAITLKAGNTNEDMTANVATIKAYIDNLKTLGVDTTKGFMVSVKVNFPSDSGYYGYMASNYVGESYFLSGTIFKNNARENYVKNITINPMGRCDEIV